jgi:hypothetical protein
MSLSNESYENSVKIADNSLWIKHIDIDKDASVLLGYMPEDTRVIFEIDGTQGEFAKMADGKDGRPTPGYKPIGAMKEFWSTLQRRRGERVPFKIIERKSSYLTAVQAMMTEWDSASDEQAFRDL